MKYYWYDHKTEGRKTDRPSLVAFEELLQLLEVDVERRTLLPDFNATDRVYFVHAGDLSTKSQTDWERACSLERRIHTIFVSSHPGGLVSNAPGAHTIDSPLGEIVRLLKHEPDRARRFIQSCEDAAPDISCFRKDIPEFLISAYLISLAIQAHNEFDLDVVPEDLWERAQNEFEKNGGHGRFYKIESHTVQLKFRDMKSVLATVDLGYCPSRAAIRRRQLSHNYLEYLIATPEDRVIERWRGLGWPMLEREFVKRARDAVNLFKDVDAEFSPVHLIDRLSPISDLPATSRQMIKESAHASYLKNSGIADLKAGLLQACGPLNSELERLLQVWGQRVSEAAEQDVRKRWLELHRHSQKLLYLLKQLRPQIMLP